MSRPVSVHATTVDCGRLVRELASEVMVGPAFRFEEAEPEPFPSRYKAVWDTGATSTCITVALADSLKLEQIGVCTSQGVTGSAECRTFLVSLFLPNGIVVPELEVSDCQGDIGCDVLIGMDVIGMGDFAVSNFNRTVFTYRTPSLERIDFVTQRPHQYQAISRKIRRNAPCPCGSGKKYKNCHGT